VEQEATEAVERWKLAICSGAVVEVQCVGDLRRTRYEVIGGWQAIDTTVDYWYLHCREFGVGERGRTCWVPMYAIRELVIPAA
jgi:hypothetical protein